MRFLVTGCFLIFSIIGQTQVISHPSLETELSGHTCTFRGGENFIVCGGFDGEDFSKSAFESTLYSDEPWTQIEDMNQVRYTHQTIKLNSHDLFVSGGWNGEEINHSSTEIYSNEFNTWLEGPEMNSGRSNHRATLLDDGKILITGGFNGDINTDLVDIYDPETNLITAAAPMIYGRSSHTATLLSNGKVLVAGGYNPDYDFQMDECELYDPLTDTWTETGSLNEGRDNHAAPVSFSSSLNVFVTGGRTFNSTLNLFEGLTTVEEYNITSGEWVFESEMPNGQSYHAVYEFEPVGFMIIGGAYHTGNDVYTTYSTTAYGIGFEWAECCEYVADGRYLAASGQTDDGFYYNEILVCGGVGNNTCELYVSDVNVLELKGVEVEIYPNPTSDFLQIQLFSSSGFADVEIMDLNGKIIKSLIQYDTSRLMDIKDLETGLYMIKITSGDKSWNKKILKI